MCFWCLWILKEKPLSATEVTRVQVKHAVLAIDAATVLALININVKNDEILGTLSDAQNLVRAHGLDSKPLFYIEDWKFQQRTSL